MTLRWRLLAQGAIGYSSVSRGGSSLSVPSTYVSAEVRPFTFTVILRGDCHKRCGAHRWRSLAAVRRGCPTVPCTPITRHHLHVNCYFILICAVRPLGLLIALCLYSACTEHDSEYLSFVFSSSRCFFAAINTRYLHFAFCSVETLFVESAAPPTATKWCRSPLRPGMPDSL